MAQNVLDEPFMFVRFIGLLGFYYQYLSVAALPAILHNIFFAQDVWSYKALTLHD